MATSRTRSRAMPRMRVDDVDVERLSPLGTDHITLTGRYRIALPDTLRDRGGYRDRSRLRSFARHPTWGRCRVGFNPGRQRADVTERTKPPPPVAATRP